MRFLAVMVVATPCPLLIAIPVAIIGSISFAARRAIIVRDPSSLETADTCQYTDFRQDGHANLRRTKTCRAIRIGPHDAQTKFCRLLAAWSGIQNIRWPSDRGCRNRGADHGSRCFGSQ